MSYQKNLLLIGDTVKVKEFAGALTRAGAQVSIATDTDKALVIIKGWRPDGIVFIVPVYWESVSDFVTRLRREPLLATIPIIYLGDFIEASDQIILKSQDVHTLTLGPVPTEEAVRFILSKV